MAIFGANEVDDLTAKESHDLAVATKEVQRHFPGAVPIDPKWLALGTLGVIVAKTYRPRVKQLMAPKQQAVAKPPPSQHQQPPKPADAMPPEPTTQGWDFGIDPLSTGSGLH